MNNEYIRIEYPNTKYKSFHSLGIGMAFVDVNRKLYIKLNHGKSNYNPIHNVLCLDTGCTGVMEPYDEVKFVELNIKVKYVDLDEI